jgi:type VI secretion system FHA domain protein
VALTLRVTSFHSHALGAQSTKTFGAAGGSIGRQPGNDWVLPDPERFVSGSHAAVVCRNGNWYLRDLSTNGTFHNGSPQPIGNGREQPLVEGDRLQLGEYEIVVSIDRTDYASVTGPTGFDMGRPSHGAGASGPRVATGPTGRSAPAGLPGVLGPQDLGQPTSADPLDFFSDNSRPPVRPPNDPGVLSQHNSALEDFYQPPPLERVPPPPPPQQHLGPAAVIPEDWDKTGFSSAPRRAPAMQPPAQQPAAYAPTALVQQLPPSAEESAGGLAALLVAAGLDPSTARMAAAAPGAQAVLGQVLGVVVQGMLDVLKARTEIKSQFRVPLTSMRPVENNPLKFSANAAQAMQNLLTARNPAYLGPVDAFDEGFQDIKAHQIAMMAGMRAAFDSMLERFNPDELAERFEKRLKRASVLSMGGKGKYWDLYRDMYEEWTQDADLNFQRLFGDKFAQAYEEQMRRLTVVRR